MLEQGFNGELELRYLREEPVDGKRFKVIKVFSYVSKEGYWYRIPLDMHIARIGKYGYATVLYDWLCEYKIVPRKKANKLFLEAMKLLGVGWFKRRTMYAGVRIYSIATFKK